MALPFASFLHGVAPCLYIGAAAIALAEPRQRALRASNGVFGAVVAAVALDPPNPSKIINVIKINNSTKINIYMEISIITNINIFMGCYGIPSFPWN